MITDRQREAHFKDWLNEYRGLFHRISRAYAWTPEDQADLLQEMAAQLWRSLPGFKAQCQPVTWVYRVCLNTALGWRRDYVRQPAFATLDRERIALAPAVEPRPGMLMALLIGAPNLLTLAFASTFDWLDLWMNVLFWS